MHVIVVENARRVIVGNPDQVSALPPVSSSYTLPVASADTLGGIKVGSNLAINSDGVLSALSGGGGGGATSMSQLSDVLFTSLSSSDLIAYNAAISKWVNVKQPTVTDGGNF